MTCQFDTLLEGIGTGQWNLITVLLLGFLTSQFPFNTVGGAFLAPVVGHSCKIPPDGFPIIHEDSNYLNVTEIDACWYHVEAPDGIAKVPCTEWEFDNSTFLTTLTSEFQLVCEREYLRPTFQSMYFFGALIAAPLIGFLSDRYGRKKVLVVGITIYSVVSNCLNWLPNIWLILATRFVLGLMHPASLSTVYALAMEVSEPKHRARVGILGTSPLILGYFTWAGLAYLIREWRWLMFVAPLPSPLILIMLYFVDESPRWLILKGHHNHALKVLHRAQRLNDSRLPPDEELLDIMREMQAQTVEGKCPEEKDSSRCVKIKKFLKDEVLALVRTSEIRRVTLVIYVVYLVCGMVYYGLSLSAGTLGSNPYIYMAITAAMEIPGSTVTIPMVNNLGRKKTSIICYLLSGMFLLLLIFVPKGTAATWMAHIGKMCIAAAYQVIYLHASELFPTEVRVRGLGTSSMVSKIGSIIVPFIVDGLGNHFWWAPSLVLGCSSLVACAVYLLLPETLKRALPDSVAGLEEADNEEDKSIRRDSSQANLV